jgi:hypothetical protein
VAGEDVYVDRNDVSIEKDDPRCICVGISTKVCRMLVVAGHGPLATSGDCTAEDYWPDLSKWILSIGMLLGRLELFAVLVLFFPSFWRV